MNGTTAGQNGFIPSNERRTDSMTWIKHTADRTLSHDAGATDGADLHGYQDYVPRVPMLVPFVRI